MTDLINQLMNDKAVYRTAPATPGLLIIYLDPRKYSLVVLDSSHHISIIKRCFWDLKKY